MTTFPPGLFDHDPDTLAEIAHQLDLTFNTITEEPKP